MNYEQLAAELGEIRFLMAQITHTSTITNTQRGENFVLSYLAKHQNQAYPKELSKALGVSSARVAAILNQLETKGMIRRQADPTNKRQAIILLLEPGLQQKQKNADHFMAETIPFLQALGPEDAQAYLRIQKKILAYFTEKQT